MSDPQRVVLSIDERGLGTFRVGDLEIAQLVTAATITLRAGARPIVEILVVPDRLELTADGRLELVELVD